MAQSLVYCKWLLASLGDDLDCKWLCLGLLLGMWLEGTRLSLLRLIRIGAGIGRRIIGITFLIVIVVLVILLGILIIRLIISRLSLLKLGPILFLICITVGSTGIRISVWVWICDRLRI